MNEISAGITAVGAYVPEFVLSNEKLEKLVDTTSEWIFSRTGIQERRILKKEEGQGSSYLAIKAIQNLLSRKPIDIKEVDLLIMASATHDMPVAISAAHVATQVGAVNAFAFDVDAACSGFLYGMSIATAYIKSKRYKKILLVGADQMSSIIDYEDRTTCIIFGDGAGAALFEPNYEGLGYQDEFLQSNGIGRDFLKIEAGGSVMPATEETVKNKMHFVKQDGKNVFKYAVSGMSESIKKIMDRNHLSHDDIHFLVPHQANKRIIDATANFAKLDPDKVLINIHKYGNTTTATLPLLLAEYEHLMKKGDNIIFSTFGGGFTWGAAYYKWAY